MRPTDAHGPMGERSSNWTARAHAEMATGLPMTLGLLLVPFIPGLRDIPRLVPIYRLIWRRYYGEEAR